MPQARLCRLCAHRHKRDFAPGWNLEGIAGVAALGASDCASNFGGESAPNMSGCSSNNISKMSVSRPSVQCFAQLGPSNFVLELQQELLTTSMKPSCCWTGVLAHNTCSTASFDWEMSLQPELLTSSGVRPSGCNNASDTVLQGIAPGVNSTAWMFQAVPVKGLKPLA